MEVCMKKNILILLLSVIFLFGSEDVFAARRVKEPLKPISFVGVYCGVGYSQLMHKIPNTSVLGGGTGWLGFEYFMRQSKYFNFYVGIEGMYFNSFSKMNGFSLDSKFYYNDPNYNNLEIDYYMNFSDYIEQHNNFSFNLPVMIGAEYKFVYLAIGAKFKYALSSNYYSKSLLTTHAKDPEFIEDLENLPNHSLGTNLLLSKGKLSSGLDIVASAEVGLVLDPWLSIFATRYGQNPDRRIISYRLGFFVDYGVLNINKFSHENMMVAFPNMQMQLDGRYVVPISSINNIYNNSILASDISKGINYNSFVAGVKFKVLFQVSKTPKVVKKIQKKRPEAREVVLKGDYIKQLIYGVKDAQNDKPLNARILIFNLDNQTDTVFNDFVSTEDGFGRVGLNAQKRYAITVSKDGYISYSDTINSLNEILLISLQPIKRNTVVILDNLFFDTGKTIIKNTSAESLDKLYQLLVDNPTIKVIITGHTDNVASDKYNLKLSEGRAKAVYDEMVRRGIDPKRMKWQGKGEREPIDTNKTEEGRAANRRVEFKIL